MPQMEPIQVCSVLVIRAPGPPQYFAWSPTSLSCEESRCQFRRGSGSLGVGSCHYWIFWEQLLWVFGSLCTGVSSQGPLTWQKNWDHTDAKGTQQINFLKQELGDYEASRWLSGHCRLERIEPALLFCLILRLLCHTPSTKPCVSGAKISAHFL